MAVAVLSLVVQRNQGDVVVLHGRASAAGLNEVVVVGFGQLGRAGKLVDEGVQMVGGSHPILEDFVGHEPWVLLQYVNPRRLGCEVVFVFRQRGRYQSDVVEGKPILIDRRPRELVPINVQHTHSIVLLREWANGKR